MEKIRSWNAIDDYNASLTEIEQGNKQGLKCLFDSYVVDFYFMTYEVFHNCEKTKDILSDLFVDIWNHTETYRLSDGNCNPKLYLEKKLKQRIEKETKTNE